MSLSELSDYEINKLVAEIKYPDAEEVIRTIGEDSLMVTHWVSGCLNMTDCLDYCNDDALAFRLMVDNKMTRNRLETPDGDYYYYESPGFPCSNKRPENDNRAISECYILMNQEGGK